MLVDVQDIDVDTHDTLLPDVGEFNQYNFTETLLDINELDKQIIEVLLATKVMDDDLKKALQNAFINIGNSEKGKEVISIYSHEGYQEATSADYDNERKAQELIQEKQ